MNKEFKNLVTEMLKTISGLEAAFLSSDKVHIVTTESSCLDWEQLVKVEDMVGEPIHVWFHQGRGVAAYAVGEQLV